MKSSENLPYTISIMSQDEMAIAINWAKHEGWNPGLNDASTFYEADNTGFFVGKIGDLPIATISAVKYGLTFGFVGLYIVKEGFRGKGYGIRIWEEAISSLKGRSIGLDGVVAQQDNYKKSGFRLAHRNIRFAGKSTRNHSQGGLNNIYQPHDADTPLIEQYDKLFFPESRAAFLTNWIKDDKAYSLFIREKSKILGYGCIRACDKGFKIGPLNAEDHGLALELFSGLTNSIPSGSDIFMDVPEPNSKAIDIAERARMKPSFETARMYAGVFPRLPLDKIYGITSFELG